MRRLREKRHVADSRAGSHNPQQIRAALRDDKVREGYFGSFHSEYSNLEKKEGLGASRRAPSTRPGARRPSPLSSPPAALRPGSSGRPRRVVGRARAHAPQVAVHWAADCLNIRTDPVSGTSAYEAYFGHKPDLTAICELGASVAALDDGADAPRVPLVAHDGVVVDVAVVVDSGQIVGQGACLARVVLAGGDDGGAAVLPPLVCSQSEPTQSCRPTEWQMAVVAFHR